MFLFIFVNCLLQLLGPVFLWLGGKGELEAEGGDSVHEGHDVEVQSGLEGRLELLEVLGVQAESIAVLVVLGANHVKGLVIIDGFLLIL